MNKKEFDKKYANGDVSVHCKTEVLAEEFLETAYKNGHKWLSNRKIRNFHKVYGSDTCYSIGSFITYGNIETRKKTMKIVEFNGFSTHSEYKLILNEDKQTIVLIDSEGNKGKANCLPDDEFNLGFGVTLAMAKLNGDQDEVKRLVELSNNKPTSFKIEAKISLDTETIKAQIEKTKIDLEKKFDDIKFKAIDDFEKSIIDGLGIDMGDGLDDLKVGDTVLIRSDLVIGEEYGQLFNESMKKFLGTEITLDSFRELEPLNRSYYKTDKSSNIWGWTKEMFAKKL